MFSVIRVVLYFLMVAFLVLAYLFFKMFFWVFGHKSVVKGFYIWLAVACVAMAGVAFVCAFLMDSEED